MKVRSPKLNYDALNEVRMSPTSLDRSSNQLAENDASHFLPKNVELSHLGDPSGGTLYSETTGKADVDPVDTGIAQRTWQFFIQPFSWTAMLCREFDVTFVVGVIVVYGISQGVGFALNRVVVDYYWKDVQGAQPSTVQFYRSIMWSPWDVKPIYGLLTDLLPFFGYHRRPYFVLSGLVTVSTYLVLVLGGKLHAATALTMFVGASTATAMADVTIDALVATKSRERPELATHLQSFCGSCSSIGGLLGFLISGLAVHAFGSQIALGIMIGPGVLLLILGFTIFEHRLPRHLWHSGQVKQQMKQACSSMWATLRNSQVWQPTLYMYVSWALAPDISEGKFYWYNDANTGPGFSEEFVGVIYAMGAVGTLIGVAFYHRYLRHWTFRSLLFWVQLLLALSGMLDLVLVTGLNRKLLIPDYIFAITDEGVSQAIKRIKWMPLLVLAARLCPAGIEGTFFALLMSVDNVGMLSASWAGGLLLQATGVRRKNFKYLWLTVLIRNIMMLFPLPFLGLIPNTDPDLPILPPELLSASIEPTPVPGSEHTTIDEGKDEEDVHLPMFASDRGHQS